VLQARQFCLSKPEGSPYDQITDQESPCLRLLRLKTAGPQRRNDFELRTFRLRWCPKYYALSYAWGTPLRDCAISCNGRPLCITANLLSGLNELESISKFANSWFWVDQICIDQDNLKERGHQVNLMPSIYKSALSTVIWLGVSDGPCTEGLQLAEKIYDMRETLNGRGHPRTPKPSLRFDENLVALGLPRRNHRSWEQLERVARSHWFSRLWTMQEAFLSRRDPFVVYGVEAVGNLTSLAWGALWASRVEFQDHGSPVSLEKILQVHLESIVLLRTGAKYCDLTSAIFLTRSQHVSEKRDRIFGVYGLVQGGKNKGRLPITLTPNYEKPVNQIFQETAAHIITHDRNLLLFAFINSDPDKAGLPSWVPPFKYLSSAPVNNFSSLTASDKCFRYTHGHESKIRASAGRPASVKTFPDPCLLGLKGLRVETIQWTAKNSDISIPGFFIEAEEIVERARSPGTSTFVDVFNTLIETLSTGTNILLRPTVYDLLDFLGESAEEVPNLAYFWHHLRQMDQNAIGDEAIFRKYIRHYFQPERHRRHFITANRLIGVGPEFLKAGDVICVLFGGSAPVVLRPACDSYKIVGECFIPGYMNGEAMELMKKGKLKEEWFTLS